MVFIVINNLHWHMSWSLLWSIIYIGICHGLYCDQ